MKDIIKLKKLINRLQKEVKKTREQRFKEIFDEYAKARPKLVQNVAWRQQLTQLVTMYLEIERLWAYLNLLWVQDTDGRKEYIKFFKEVRDAVRTWNLILTRMGESFTAQPYIPVKDRSVKTAKEIARMGEKITRISKSMKKRMKKKEEHRTNPHRGRRQQKDGTLAEQYEKKEKEKEGRTEGKTKCQLKRNTTRLKLSGRCIGKKI